MKDLNLKIINWIANGETGVSSEAIAFQMAGVDNHRKFSSHPCDPSDFKRCLKLVNEIPEIRVRLDEMRHKSKYWNALIDNWDKLEKCFLEEVGGWLVDKDIDKRATKTYNMMQEIYNI